MRLSCSLFFLIYMSSCVNTEHKEHKESADTDTGLPWNTAPGMGKGVDESEGCGTLPTLTKGRNYIDVSGITREFLIDIPENYDMNTPYRLILVWHHMNGSAEVIANDSYYGLKLQSNGTAIFVAPDRYVSPGGQDDNGWPNTNDRAH